MATRRDKTRQKNEPSITDRQRRAIEAIVTGADDSAAAQAANVARQTLSRWKHHNPDFIAALNGARREAADGFADRLRGLYPLAIDALRAGLAADQPPAIRLRAAEAIIKNLAPPEGATDPEAIRARWETASAEAAHDREIAQLTRPPRNGA